MVQFSANDIDFYTQPLRSITNSRVREGDSHTPFQEPEVENRKWWKGEVGYKLPF